MSQDSKKTSKLVNTLEFKTSTFSVPVLLVATDDLSSLEQQLALKINAAPEFFKNSPLVLDLQEINKQTLKVDLNALVAVIRNASLIIVGIRAGNELQNKQALNLGIPVYPVQERAAVVEAKKPAKAPVVKAQATTSARPEINESVPTTIITHPIRSGQRIYAAGDLIVMAQVSAGAEIMAEGNIHVYSSLRGRALAGVQGDHGARIFCFDLQAELISIAGTYKVSEDLNASVRNKPVQIYLQDESLIIKDIV